MKRNDIILIVFLTVASIIGYFSMNYILDASNVEDGTANVYYNNNLILEIYLTDGTYEIIDSSYILEIDDQDFLYTVEGSNGPVIIEYINHQVRVIDETSPKNICQIQGLTSSPLRPITCLPNNIVIVIRAQPNDNLPDIITG
ncbi:MAG: NusG domain II-containing protein [Candidatus Izemoplasma sp.]